MKLLSAENPFARFFIQYSLPFLVIGIISRTFPITSPVYHLVPVLLIINILMALILIPRTGKTLSYFLIIFVFPVYCLITSAWSLNPIISLQRSLYLLLLYAGILSSVLLYKRFFPDKGLGFLLPANIIVLILSVISLVFSIPADSWTGGNGLGFMGFAGHQNTLAAALLFTLPGIIAMSIGQRAKSKEQRAKGPDDKSGFPLHSNIEQSAPINRDFHFVPTKSKASSVFRHSSFVLLLTSNVLLLVLTYSRAAILALAVGIITYLLITKSKKIIISIIVLTAGILILYLTIQPFNNLFNNFLSKDGGNILGRRTVLWEPSLEAAKMGGLFGLGYGVSEPNIKTPVTTGSHYEDGRYVREKGNSVLAMIEEVGLIGLLLFLLPMYWIIRKYSLLTTYYSLLAAALAAFLLHSQFEAWWVGVGSITLPLFLIFLFMAVLPEKS